MIKNNSNYNDVYVAFLDILGFKELVDNNDHNALQDIYDNHIFETARLLIQDNTFYNFSKGETLDVLNVSDSILIWSNSNNYRAFIQILLFVQTLLLLFIEQGVPLRGAITHGELSIRHYQNQINLFGKSITRAYNLERDQQWSGCIIDNSCVELILTYEKKMDDSQRERNVTFDYLIDKGLIVKYKIPKKNGKIEEEFAINWISKENTLLNEEYIRQSFSRHGKKTNNWDVYYKVENTVNFYKYLMSNSMK